MKKHSKIITEKLTGISTTIFDSRYRKKIKPVFKDKPGVYALYDKNNKLYYVGQTSRPIMERVKEHLTDSHSNKWERFDVYFTKEKYLEDIEALVIHIAEPKGNTQRKSKLLPKAKELRTNIHKITREIDQELEKGRIIPREGKPVNSKKQSKNLSKQNPNKAKLKKPSHKIYPKPSQNKAQSKLSLLLKSHFKTDKILRAKYKNKEYKTKWLKSSGKILYNNTLYNTLNEPTKAIVKGQRNSRTFWKIKDKKNNWVKLKDLLKTA